MKSAVFKDVQYKLLNRSEVLFHLCRGLGPRIHSTGPSFSHAHEGCPRAGGADLGEVNSQETVKSHLGKTTL